MEEIRQAIKAAVKDLFNTDIEPELTRPDEQFGDYATNVALQLAPMLRSEQASQLGKNPREIAEQISTSVKGSTSHIKEVKVEGPGFLNIVLSDEALAKLAFEQKIDRPLEGKTVVAEYSDPNPFKVLHAGHLYTSVVGDSIANLLESAGATVHRVNFGGDVGLHVGKTMWAILRRLGGENPDKLNEIKVEERPEWLTAAYVEGNNAYEDSEQAKQEIVALNKKVYQLQNDNDRDTPFAQIYWTTRQWSYDYFDQFYDSIGTKFEKYYPESLTAPIGLQTVQEQLEKGVYQKSDGAVIFDGEKYGLHTRVFINSEGLPTYEAKDVGLIMSKWNDYHFDKSVIITGNDIVEYMKVVQKSIEQFQPDLAKVSVHLTHGMVKLQGGEKMSSRKGNILRAADVLAAAEAANQKSTGRNDSKVELGAVKYAFLKQRLGGDIIYDPEESVSLQGNSGPYLQYAHARARSILSKASDPVIPTPVSSTGQAPLEESRGDQTGSLDSARDDINLTPGERSLLRKLGEYPEIIANSVSDLTPHHVANYLYELAQTFNRFYEQNRVIDDPRQDFRVRLVKSYADTLKNGLKLLGIDAPDKM